MRAVPFGSKGLGSSLWKRGTTLVVAAVVFLALQLSPGHAAAESPEGLPALEARIAQLEQSQAVQNQQISQLQSQVAALNTALAGQVQQNQSLASRLEAVENKTQLFSRAGTEVFLTGANLHIVNGMGGTNSQNGLGNLIVGYNETRGGVAGLPEGLPGDARTGSHNIILGALQNYTGSQAIMSGWGNSSNGLGSLVTGLYNVADGDGTVVFGVVNTARGANSTVVGGQGNTAAGPESSILGGAGNTVSGNHSTVAGGQGNTASGPLSSVSGGGFNIANALGGTVSGGLENQAVGSLNQDWMTVSGGYRNKATAWSSTIGGGIDLTNSVAVSWMAGRSFTGNIVQQANLFKTPG